MLNRFIGILFFLALTISCSSNYPPIHAVWHNLKTKDEIEITCQNNVILPFYLRDSLKIDNDNLLYLEASSNPYIDHFSVINSNDTFRLGAWHKLKAQLEIGDKTYKRKVVYMCNL